jgi:hypothetical protein
MDPRSPARPPTYAEAFHLANPTAWTRLHRDVRLLVFLWRQMLAFWLFRGARLRRAWRRANAERRPFVLEDHVDLLK